MSWHRENTSKHTILIIYRRPMGNAERFLKALSNCGEFTHVESYCIIAGTGWTFTNYSFNEMVQTKDCEGSYIVDWVKYAYHAIDVSAQEHAAFVAWNKAQVANRCRYNYSDLVFQMIPGARMFVPDLTTAQALQPKKLFCSQAVLLGLQHALAKNSPVAVRLSGINTRTCCPTALAGSLGSILGSPLQAKACGSR